MTNLDIQENQKIHRYKNHNSGLQHFHGIHSLQFLDHNRYFYFLDHYRHMVCNLDNQNCWCHIDHKQENWCSVLCTHHICHHLHFLCKYIYHSHYNLTHLNLLRDIHKVGNLETHENHPHSDHNLFLQHCHCIGKIHFHHIHQIHQDYRIRYILRKIQMISNPLLSK